AHGSPLPLGEVGAPAPPISLVSFIVLEPLIFFCFVELHRIGHSYHQNSRELVHPTMYDPMKFGGWDALARFMGHVFELGDGAFDEKIERPVDQDADLGQKTDHFG